MEADILIDSPDDVQRLVVNGLPINTTFRLAITNKAWASLALRHAPYIDFDTPAGKFALENYPTDDNDDKKSITVSLGRLNRVARFKIGWQVLTDNVGMIENILKAQGGNLRGLFVENTGERRIRSAAELNRLIGSIGSHLTSLALDEVNLAKCGDTFKLIATHCTGLKSLCLQGANLPPKSSAHLTSLRFLESLFWDFGNPELARKLKSVPSDMEVIRQLTKLEKLGLVGGGGFPAYFPEAYSCYLRLAADSDAIHALISDIKKAVPPSVGIKGLVLSAGSTLLGSLAAVGASIDVLQVCLDEGAYIDSFEVCPGLPTASPLLSSLLHVPVSLNYPTSFHQQGEGQVNEMEVFKFLIRQGASLENLHGNRMMGQWSPAFASKLAATSASNIFAFAAQNYLSSSLIEHVTSENRFIANAQVEADFIFVRFSFIFGELLEETVKKHKCSYQTLLIDPKLNENVLNLALLEYHPEHAVRMLQLGIHTKLGLDINYIDKNTKQTLIMRIWSLVETYGHPLELVDKVVELGGDIFHPCPNYPNGIASYPPQHSSFIASYVASGRQPAWPFVKSDTYLADYLESAIHLQDVNYFEYLLENVVPGGRLPILMESFVVLRHTFCRCAFYSSGSRSKTFAEALLLITAKEYAKSGVPFPASMLPNALGVFHHTWNARLALSVLRAVLPTMDQTYNKEVHEAILDQRLNLVRLFEVFVGSEVDQELRASRLSKLDRIFTLIAYPYDLSSLQSDPSCEVLNELPMFKCKLAGVNLDSRQQLLQEVMEDDYDYQGY